ncbi:MAG: helix-turn-helix transcriptional regulator [Bryobacterales bacterium]|nr:helix-turn-helix transcriptional regulator [Bryobacterales bacterium]
MSDTSFDGRLLAIYDAAENPALWEPCMELLCRATESANGAILRHNLLNNHSAGTYFGFDRTAIEPYFQYFSSVNPWLPKPGYTEAVPGAHEAWRGIDFVPNTRLRRTEFYTDWGRQHDVVNSIGAGLAIEGADLTYLCFGRGDRDGIHSDEAVALSTRLLPHLRRALGVQALRAQIANLKTAAGSVPQALLLVSRHGRVVERTAEAGRLIESRTVLTVERTGRLAAVNPLDRAAWDALLASSQPSLARLAGRGTGDDVVAAAEPVKGSATAHHPFTSADAGLLVITLLPLSQTMRHGGGERAAALFGLTPAEARLAVTLTACGSLDRSAEQLDISRNTAKTQLAAIFRKTGAARQGEVIRLFAQIGVITHMGDDGTGQTGE